MSAFVASTAIVEEGVILGAGVKVWNFTQIRRGACILDDTQIGSHCYLDTGVWVGQACKVQSGVMLFRGTWVGDGVFLGPGCMALNDRDPHATLPDGRLLTDADWNCEGVTILDGASIGAGSVLLPGITIGKGAMVGAGSVVTRSVPDGAMVYGNPARPPR